MKMKPSLALLDVAAILVAAAAAESGGDASLRRRLSFQKIAGYGPSSQVTDHCAIDLDQAAIEAQLSIKTPQSFENAQRIYNEGGNSESYARITLSGDGLAAAVKKEDKITGKNAEGLMVAGRAFEDYEKGSKTIKVRYSTTDIQESYVGCQVGGLVDTNTKRCFVMEGDLKIGDTSYPYTYNPATDNRNGRTIAGFSEEDKARDVMRANPDSIGCRGCPYQDFKYFYDYYGTDDYAHQFVEAAFEGTSTQFIDGNKGPTPFKNGNADFSRYDYVGKQEFIKRATTCMNIFMFTIRQWEAALDDCERGCMDCNKGPAHLWDEGVCFYTGSIEGKDGRADGGKLLHQLADDMCGDMKTCGVEGTDRAGTAKLNYDLSGLFSLGKFQLQTGNCPAARASKDEIVRKMYVPLIQGAIMRAYQAEFRGGERVKAEGAAFAAAVLPRIHAASPGAANIIWNQMKVGAPSTASVAVKEAFEIVYQDIGISCADVGGFWDEGQGKYYNLMEPCVDADSLTTTRSVTNINNTLAIILGCTFGALFAIAAAMVIYMRSREKEGQPVFKASVGDGDESIKDLN